jgi:radical SAM superfamily enzyme
MKETQNENTITIEDKIYNKADLPEQAWIILENLEIIQNRMEKIQEDLVIHRISKDAMIDALIGSVSGIQPIDTVDYNDLNINLTDEELQELKDLEIPFDDLEGLEVLESLEE